MTIVNEEEIIKLSERKIEAIVNDPVKSAEAVNLVYVTDAQPGILRVKNGKGFYYVHGRERIKDKKQILRIQSLVIPPAWENVWICTLENGHLQATGLDIRKRKQYRYHPLWNTLRNHTKFYRLHAFGKALPAIDCNWKKTLHCQGYRCKKYWQLW